MNIQQGDIVVSAAGHDKGKRFLVLGVQQDRVTVADGKTRRTEKPKLKNMKHLILEGPMPAEMSAKIPSDRPSNTWVRKVLAQSAETDSTEA